MVRKASVKKNYLSHLVHILSLVGFFFKEYHFMTKFIYNNTFITT